MIKELTMDEVFLVRDFPISVARRDPQPAYPRHKHVFTELVIVLRGKAMHVVDDHEFPVRSGDAFVIAGNREHEFGAMEDLALVNVIFDPNQLGLNNWHTTDLPGFRTLFFLEPEYRSFHRFESRLRLVGADLARASQLATDLEKELVEQKPGYRLTSTALLMELLVHLSRCYKDIESPETQSLLRIADAINYIESHFAEPISHDTLAEIACMSRRNFQRVFKRAMGCNAKEYTIKMRVNHARELLASSDLPITGVAYDVGFQDSNYFSRQFRKVTGMTPNEYRKLRQG